MNSPLKTNIITLDFDNLDPDLLLHIIDGMFIGSTRCDDIIAKCDDDLPQHIHDLLVFCSSHLDAAGKVITKFASKEIGVTFNDKFRSLAEKRYYGSDSMVQ